MHVLSIQQAAVGLLLAVPAFGGDGPILQPGKTVWLAGVEGRFDHFSANVKQKLLFVAALGNNSIELIDIARGRRAGTIKDIPEPCGMRFVAEKDLLYVGSGGDGSCYVYRTTDLKLVTTIKLGEDADNVRYDSEDRRIYIGYGDGALAGIDVESNAQVSDIVLKAHPESFQLESKGPRIFVNVPRAKEIAVIDRKQAKVIAEWPLAEVRDNFPMALDEEHGRLFVGCRRPARLLAISTETGKVAASAECCGDSDDLFHDPSAERVYVSGGEGYIDVFDCRSGRLVRVDQLKTAAGARTSFFAPELGMMFLAVPHRGGQNAEIRSLIVRPDGGSRAPKITHQMN